MWSEKFGLFLDFFSVDNPFQPTEIVNGIYGTFEHVVSYLVEILDLWFCFDYTLSDNIDLILVYNLIYIYINVNQLTTQLLSSRQASTVKRTSLLKYTSGGLVLRHFKMYLNNESSFIETGTIFKNLRLIPRLLSNISKIHLNYEYS